MAESGGLRLLHHARNLVAESWCHGADARDANGFAVDPWDETAESWSLLGAVVAVLESEASHDRELPLAELAAALYALSKLIDADSLVEWNDDPRQTQGKVIAVLDEAAATYGDSCAVVEVSLN